MPGVSINNLLGEALDLLDRDDQPLIAAHLSYVISLVTVRYSLPDNEADDHDGL